MINDRTAQNRDILTKPGRFFAKRILPAAIALALLFMAAAPAALILADGGTVLHTVLPGENLFRIALRYGVPLRDLLAANNIGNENYVRVGQVLVIPGVAADQPDQAAGASAQVSVSTPPAPDQLDAAASAPGRVQLHQVGPGETLFRIALRYGVSVNAIAQANSLVNPNVLVAGQTLVIPDGSGFGGGVRDATAGSPYGTSPAQPLITTPTGFATIPAPADASAVDFSAAPWFRLTHYCLGGAMSSGRSVYLGAVAADASVFPLGTRLLIEGYGFFTVEDRFAWDAHDARLDVWVPTCAEAMQRGVQYRRVFVVVPR